MILFYKPVMLQRNHDRETGTRRDRAFHRQARLQSLLRVRRGETPCRTSSPRNRRRRHAGEPANLKPSPQLDASRKRDQEDLREPSAKNWEDKGPRLLLEQRRDLEERTPRYPQ